MAIVKLSAGERRRLSAFITCLLLAALAWVVTVLNTPSSFNVKRVLTFKNVPQKRAFHLLQTDTVDVTIKGTGWQMLFSRINNQDKPILVDLHTLDVDNYVVLTSQLKEINEREEGQEIAAINPDTLYFDFSSRAVKRVPVRLLAHIKYQRQFAQSNSSVVNPAYVMISGPAAKINSINRWDTDSLLAKGVNETIRTRLNLQASGEGNISVYPKSVQVTIPIDEFTEKTLDVPIKLVNNDDYEDVKIFPERVKVTFITSLKRYAEINEDFFEAQADLNLWKLQGYSTLPVNLKRYPPFCKIVSIGPPNIDFIVRK